MKEGWHEFDSRGYDDLIKGTATPPDEKEKSEITDKNNEEVKSPKRQSSKRELQTNKNGTETW